MPTIYLVLYDIERKRYFKRWFTTEFEKDKFKNKIKHSKRVIIINESELTN